MKTLAITASSFINRRPESSLELSPTLFSSMNGETGANVPDAIVKVYATPSERGVPQVAPALNSPADREYYVGRLEMEEKGVWAIDVVIEHPELGNDKLTLATEVFERARGGSNLVLGTILWVFVSIAFIVVAFYLVRKSKRAKIKLEQIRHRAQ